MHRRQQSHFCRGVSSIENGRAASNARLARSTKASAPTAPTTCRATGNPHLFRAQGTDAAGWWVKLKG